MSEPAKRWWKCNALGCDFNRKPVLMDQRPPNGQNGHFWIEVTESGEPLAAADFERKTTDTKEYGQPVMMPIAPSITNGGAPCKQCFGAGLIQFERGNDQPCPRCGGNCCEPLAPDAKEENETRPLDSIREAPPLAYGQSGHGGDRLGNNAQNTEHCPAVESASPASGPSERDRAIVTECERWLSAFEDNDTAKRIMEISQEYIDQSAALAEARQRIETLTHERNERWGRWEETETARVNAVNQLAEARREVERLKRQLGIGAPWTFC